MSMVMTRMTTNVRLRTRGPIASTHAVAYADIPCPHCDVTIPVETDTVQTLPETWGKVDRCPNCGKPYEVEITIHAEADIYLLERNDG